MKEKMLKLLSEQGYTAKLTGSVIMVYYQDCEDPFDKIKKLLREAGYNGSFGCKRVKLIEEKIENITV